MPSTLPAAESSLDAIQRLASAGLPAQELLEQAAARIERVVPTDGWFMAATDPQTTLCIGTGLVRDLPAEQCQPHWDYEFLVPDYLKYADIVRSGRRVADLHDATGGRPERSPRFKQFSAATGFRSEVRVVFTVGDAAWGLAQLNRLSGRFTDEEKAWLERAAASIAPGLRRAMVAEPSCTPGLVRGPGIVLSADVAPLIVEAYGLTGRELRSRGRSPGGSAPPRSPPSCTSRRTRSATTSRRSSRRSASPAAASSCTGSSPSTTRRRRTSAADRDSRGSLPDARGGPAGAGCSGRRPQSR